MKGIIGTITQMVLILAIYAFRSIELAVLATLIFILVELKIDNL